MIKAYARASALLSLEAGIAKHCLGAKIVDIAIFRFGSGLNFKTKVPCQFARAHYTVWHPRWPVGAAKQKQVKNICTCTARAQCSPPPWVIRRQVGLVKVYPCLVSLGQSFLKPKEPSLERFSAPGACNLHHTEVASPMDFKLVRYACDLRVWDRWRHLCVPQGREKMMRSKHLRVHCTCTMHPSPINHTAPSRPCPGAPMY